MSSAFDHFPATPRHTLLTDAHAVLSSAHASCTSFQQAFVATGRETDPNEHDQDLLRAMLAFATAGLDATAKQIVSDGLATAIDAHEGPRAQFETFIKRRLGRDDGHDLMAKALSSANYRAHLLQALIADLTAGSLQSREELSRVGAHFGLPSRDFIANQDILDVAFKVRNQITHEMDIDLEADLRRRHRNHADMVEYTNAVFKVGDRLLRRVDDMLWAVPSR